MSVGHKQILLLLDAFAYTIALLLSTKVVMFLHSTFYTYDGGGAIPNATSWLLGFSLLLPVYILLMLVANMYAHWRRFRDEFMMISAIVAVSTIVLASGSVVSSYIEGVASSNAPSVLHIFIIPTILGVIWIGVATMMRGVVRLAATYEYVTLLVPTIDDVKKRAEVLRRIYEGKKMKYRVSHFYSLDGSDVEEIECFDGRIIKVHSLTDKHRPRVAIVAVEGAITQGDIDTIQVAKTSFLETILVHEVVLEGTAENKESKEVDALREEITNNVFFLGNGWHRHFRRWIKRGADLIGVALLSVVVVPLLLVLMVVIRANSNGSPIYRHRRVGIDGEDIYVFKLRTMYEDAEERLEQILESDENMRLEWEKYRKIKNDPRVTPVGRIIRKLSLDELPQIINILMGNMSFVGPRPVTREEIENNYRDKAYYYQMVLPGITGLWQIDGRSIVPYEHRVLMDVAYVQRNSLLLDLLIVVKTPFKLLFSKGSY